MILLWSVVVPIVVAIIYFVVGWSVCKHLIKNGTIEKAGEYWFYLIFWFPAFIVGAIIMFFRWAGKLPKRIAENAINKHA